MGNLFAGVKGRWWLQRGTGAGCGESKAVLVCRPGGEEGGVGGAGVHKHTHSGVFFLRWTDSAVTSCKLGQLPDPRAAHLSHLRGCCPQRIASKAGRRCSCSRVISRTASIKGCTLPSAMGKQMPPAVERERGHGELC